MRASQSSFEHEIDAGRLGGGLLRQIIDRGAEAAIDDDGVGARPGKAERFEQGRAVVADDLGPADGYAHFLEPLRDRVVVGVDDLAGQNLVAGADHLDRDVAPAAQARCFFRKAAMRSNAWSEGGEAGAIEVKRSGASK